MVRATNRILIILGIDGFFRPTHDARGHRLLG
jgi:hypothetical protein